MTRMRPGDAFFLNIADSHRYFVIEAASNLASRVIVFNFTTHRPDHCDDTCQVSQRSMPV